MRLGIHLRMGDSWRDRGEVVVLLLLASRLGLSLFPILWSFH